MNSYDLLMTPLETAVLKKVRKQLIANAYGRVLELGFGTGVNVDYYNTQTVTQIIGLDPSLDDTKPHPHPLVHLKKGTAMAIPYPDKSFDCVVATLTLCSVEDVQIVLSEIHRVLKDTGLYLFLEHTHPNTRFLSNLFDRMAPSWQKHMGNCKINMHTDFLIQQNHFEITNLSKRYKDILSYGIAIKA